MKTKKTPKLGYQSLFDSFRQAGYSVEKADSLAKKLCELLEEAET